MTTGRRFLVAGRVQGVWFRESAREQAQRLGITGHALNLANGTVEVVAFGEPESLSELKAWLHEGPPMAQVSSVVEAPVEGAPPEGFRTGWSPGGG